MRVKYQPRDQEDQQNDHGRDDATHSASVMAVVTPSAAGAEGAQHRQRVDPVAEPRRRIGSFGFQLHHEVAVKRARPEAAVIDAQPGTELPDRDEHLAVAVVNRAATFVQQDHLGRFSRRRVCMRQRGAE